MIKRPGIPPLDYKPRPPWHLTVDQIVLAKGSTITTERQRYVGRICSAYPEARVIEQLKTQHNRIDLGEADARKRQRRGKRTLVIGVHASAVRFSSEEGNACPNYWHFSPTGFCFYRCQYCYLAGATGIWHSPSVKVFVNLEDILGEIDRQAQKLGKPTAFYCGKLQDGLALDPLTGYSQVLVPFFAEHPYARQVVLTKSADMDNLLGLDHGGNTILSWSLNPPEVATEFERNVPSVEERLAAMVRCTDAGFSVRAVLMPMIPVPGWREAYGRFVTDLLSRVPVQRLTVGGICSYRNAVNLMEKGLGGDNVISRHMDSTRKMADGRRRYPRDLRVEMYQHILDCARKVRPDVEVALCLEEHGVWESLGLADHIGRCNCVL